MKTICSHCNGKSLIPHPMFRGNYCLICPVCLGSGFERPLLRIPTLEDMEGFEPDRTIDVDNKKRVEA